MSRPAIAVLGALTLLVGARVVRSELGAQRKAWPKTIEEPWAPSPKIARIATLGYGELGADLFYLRLRVYFGGYDTTASGIRSLVDAVVALDPHFKRIYEVGARVVGFADTGFTEDDAEWSARLLERGIAEFPDDWQLAKLGGEIYLLDLKTDDEAQAAAWKKRGAELLEKAVHEPGAPPYLGTLLANARTQLGQHDRARETLLELIRTTDNPDAKQKMLKKLAELEHSDAQALADEEQWMRDRFDDAKKRALPEADDDMYILLGDPPKPYIDFGDLVAEPDLGLDKDTFEPVE